MLIQINKIGARKDPSGSPHPIKAVLVRMSPSKHGYVEELS